MVEIFSWISHFSFIVSFFAPLVGGETAVMLLAFLSGQGGGFNLWTVIVFSFLGMISLDTFWFMMTRSRWSNKVEGWFNRYETYEKLESKIEKFSDHSDVVILLISKIMVGTRILVLIYLSMRKISYLKFLAYNSISTFIWAIMLGYFGWFSGRGYYSLKETYDNVLLGVFSVAGVVIVFYIFIAIARKWILQKK